MERDLRARSGVSMCWERIVGLRTARDQRIVNPLVPDEVTALIHYASENGLDHVLRDDEIVGLESKTSHGTHSTLLAALNDALTAYTSAAPERRGSDKSNNVIRLYAILSKITAPVNGRTLLNTMHMTCITVWLVGLTGVLMVLALMGVLALDPKSRLHEWANTLALLSPFVWGGLGACVYFLKYLYDIAKQRSFDKQKLHGWYLRVLLGSILGFVVVQLFQIDIPEITNGQPELRANAVAFLVGLGVKIVYGGIEKLIKTITEKFNLSSSTLVEADASVSAYLEARLAEAITSNDHVRREMYANVIKDLRKQTDQGTG